MKSICKLQIVDENGEVYEVVNCNIVGDEIIFFTPSGLFAATRKGCVKLDNSINAI